MNLLERIYLYIVPPEIKHVYNAILEKDENWKSGYGDPYSNNVLKLRVRDKHDSFPLIIMFNEKSLVPWKEIQVRKGKHNIFHPSGYVLMKAAKRRIHMVDFNGIYLI